LLDRRPQAARQPCWTRIQVRLLLCSALLTACGTNTIPGTAVTTPSGSPTQQVSSSPTLDMDATGLTKIAALALHDPPAYATAYAAEIAREQRMAQFLLTPQPSYIPVLPPDYVTATPVLGIKECGVASQSFPWPENCWRGYINGQMVLVKAGSPPGEEYGIVWILRDNQADGDVPWYAAPQAVQGLRILAVNGTRMLLEPVVPPPTPITFTFDLATRQWIGPDGTPLPSPSPSPSPSPFPDQSPPPAPPSPGPSPLPSPSLGPSPLPRSSP